MRHKREIQNALPDGDLQGRNMSLYETLQYSVVSLFAYVPVVSAHTEVRRRLSLLVLVTNYRQKMDRWHCFLLETRWESDRWHHFLLSTNCLWKPDSLHHCLLAMNCRWEPDSWHLLLLATIDGKRAAGTISFWQQTVDGNLTAGTTSYWQLTWCEPDSWHHFLMATNFVTQQIQTPPSRLRGFDPFLHGVTSALMATLKESQDAILITVGGKERANKKTRFDFHLRYLWCW